MSEPADAHRRWGLSRRKFLAGTGALAALALLPRTFRRRRIPCKISGANNLIGHMVRGALATEPTSTVRERIVIVGSGIAGLSAARELTKRGFHDYLLLDLEGRFGGNSQYGQNAVSKFPRAAHYLPLPGVDADLVKELLADLGLITGYDDKGLPRYDEFALCHAPEERLLINGAWQEGMIPHDGLAKRDRREISRFFRLMHGFKRAKGVDGRYAFAIPKAASSHDPRFTVLDKLSMAEYLRRMKFRSPYLHWYVDYCCRDDYGARAREVSAWAGVHYFASRRFDASGITEYTLLTWPEGNGFLVDGLLRGISGKVRNNSLVLKVEEQNGAVIASVLDAVDHSVQRIECDRLIYAGPRFSASYVVSGLNPVDRLYCPWITASISLRQRDQRKPADQFAWDNVFFGSTSLGYVNAGHQRITRDSGETVLTWYLPLDHLDPKSARTWAEALTADDWEEIVVSDFLRFQPQLVERFEEIDVWILGHAMSIPRPGELWGEPLPARHGSVLFAHSDMSGFSIFEEAQYHGVHAARQVAAELT